MSAAHGQKLHSFNFDKLINAYKSNTLKNYKLTLEFTLGDKTHAAAAEEEKALGENELVALLKDVKELEVRIRKMK
jgi:hypothetical protein